MAEVTSTEVIGKRTSTMQCYIVNNLISPLKSSYYTSIINEDSSDQRVLFKTVNKLMQRPQRRDICLLLAMLCLLIQLLTFSLPQSWKDTHCPCSKKQRSIASWWRWIAYRRCWIKYIHEFSQEDVKEFAYKPLSKSCCLDPLLASVLKGCLPELPPTTVSPNCHEQLV